MSNKPIESFLTVEEISAEISAVARALEERAEIQLNLNTVHDLAKEILELYIENEGSMDNSSRQKKHSNPPPRSPESANNSGSGRGYSPVDKSAYESWRWEGSHHDTPPRYRLPDSINPNPQDNYGTAVAGSPRSENNSSGSCGRYSSPVEKSTCGSWRWDGSHHDTPPRYRLPDSINPNPQDNYGTPVAENSQSANNSGGSCGRYSSPVEKSTCGSWRWEGSHHDTPPRYRLPESINPNSQDNYGTSVADSPGSANSGSSGRYSSSPVDKSACESWRWEGSHHDTPPRYRLPESNLNPPNSCGTPLAENNFRMARPPTPNSNPRNGGGSSGSANSNQSPQSCNKSAETSYAIHYNSTNHSSYPGSSFYQSPRDSNNGR